MNNSRGASLKATLTFALSKGPEQTYSHSFTVPSAPAEGGPTLLAAQIFAEIEKEMRFGTHWDALASVDGLSQSVRRTFSAGDVYAGKELSVHNTREVWREISNTLLSVKFLLAQARAFKEVGDIPGYEDNARANIHFNMVESFDQAVYLL